ncbi:MAG: methyltransferase domain-containing protein [Planctomycetes bacterium]|nr:methyltransferase domain-containing protein [Planctomycetota bacterium]
MSTETSLNERRPAVQSEESVHPRPATGLRALVRSIAIRARLYPHITLNRMPFKTFEFRELMKLTRFDADDRVLDLGCGTGTQTILVGRRCRQVVGVDTDPAWIARARQVAARFEGVVDCAFRHGPVEAQGFESASFDRVLSFCVIEHIPNYDEVLAELHRVLKPGGQLVLSADALEGIEDPELIERHRTDNHVFQYFRADTFRRCLEEAGFEVETLYPIFRSEAARRWFEADIRSGFRYSYLGALTRYFRLRLQEALCRQRERGLFLIASCRKR